ncbi:MAG: pyridoxamine 5'-phosphate oxidase family protein [Labilibaculum sp.]|nr:pyridoxamine 5'-phosphate oxidase family protein [Labilibaculum sp.]
MKKTLLFFATVAMLAACNSKPKQGAGETPPNGTPEQIAGKIISPDAITGATYDTIRNLQLDKKQAVEMVYNAIKDAKVFYIATVENNEARVRPVGMVTFFDGRIWFHIGKHKAGYQQIEKNPNIEVALTAADGNQWIRIRGKAITEDNKALTEMIFKDNSFLQKAYNEENGRVLGNFHLKDAIAELPSGSGTVAVHF